MLEKTFTTFHASNVLLQQQYREKGFTKYSDLIACLLLVEQNNELLMKNHEVRPTGAAPFPEVNVATHDHHGQTRGRGHGRGCGRGRGRGTSHGHVNFKNPASHQKWKNEMNEKGGQSSKTIENNCHRCGGKGHWSRNCRTPRHLVDLYHQSLKNKEKNIETHFAYEDGDFDYDMDPTHLELADFFADPGEKVDHLNGEGSTMK
ncbi:UDP-glucose flavonoid 3-O-glucosyltransferase 3-like [Trifolium medium]|uniref:UDP-glucose flavonoid 3-O-glucosyltransferase 3-like n=1 Tax=Trifolium medium TaxID=97028 RepID=A0A392P9H0_9FABA|nr:UDP-glucose flavonoid 3-O-glucosyltransferase 3-like [Trifolium medium]